VLDQAVQLLPTSHEREQSLCCGFNLGNAVLSSEQQTQIRERARQNLLEPAPDMIATACPMCKKAFTHDTDTPVREIAEIIADMIKEDTKNTTEQNSPLPQG
jgi:Fe-S oxidoreductase